MNIVISNSANVPIYEQIREQIRFAIISGQINAGEILPSIRQLARDLKISIITTMRAYKDLEDDGLVSNVQGKGCYIMPINKDFIHEQKLKEIEENLSKAINCARVINLSSDELKDMLKILLEEDN